MGALSHHCKVKTILNQTIVSQGPSKMTKMSLCLRDKDVSEAASLHRAYIYIYVRLTKYRHDKLINSALTSTLILNVYL
jgi:hypothetical protein